MSRLAIRLLIPLVLLVVGWGSGAAQEPRGPLPVPTLPGQIPPAAPQPEPPAEPPPDAPRDQDAEPQQPVFRTGINFVRVDVIVTDRDGQPITDLQPDDFEVFEDGERQQIESFKFVEATGQLQPGESPPSQIRTTFEEESAVAEEDARIFVFFLDDYHVRRSNSLGVRAPLIEFIQNQLGPKDLVGVMYPMTPLSELRLTRNHDSVARAIQNFDGRKFDYEPRNEFEYRYSNYPAETVERIRNEVSLSGLRALVIHLGGLREGRKSAIVVSEGYTDLLPPQMRDPIASMPGFQNPARRDPFAGENNPHEETARFFAQIDLLDQLEEVYGAANRANTALYMLDPRGLAAAEFDISENIGIETDRRYLRSTLDTLHILADQTDGRAIVNSNDLSAGLRQVVRDSSAYYLLGYNSSAAPADGKFHEIEVKIRRPGVQLRARKGYWAPSEEDVRRAEGPAPAPAPSAVTEALATLARPTVGRRPIDTWIGTSPAEGGKTRVTFVWEPSPASPGVEREEAGSVQLLAVDGAGTLYFRGEVPVPPADAAGVRRGHATFEVKPGEIQMRVTVQGSDGQTLDRDVQELSVPDFTAPEVTISTPAVLRARNALELRALQSDAAAVPTPARDFRRTDRLLIRFAVSAPGGAPAATAKLLNRDGDAITDLPVSPVAGSDLQQVDLPLAALPTGEYVLELEAAAGGGSAKALVPLSISS